MKTATQIADDCGMLAPEAKRLKRVMDQVDGSKDPYQNMLEEIIGALYRRIEKLEEERSGFDAAFVDLADYMQETEKETGVTMDYGIRKALSMAPSFTKGPTTAEVVAKLTT